MKVACIQSNYIPWKGYFDIIHDVDVFIFHDDLQYTKNDWRNRNKIVAPQGPVWLTIPVGNRDDRLICEVELADSTWQKKHWRLIAQNYGKAPHFSRYREFFEHVYLDTVWHNLSTLNQYLISHIASDFLGITTVFRDSREFHPTGVRLDRLLDLLKKAGATRYVSGPAARSYIDPAQFDAAGIELIYKDYSAYLEYPQAAKPFEHAVSVLDMLFQCGPDAPKLIWGWREASQFNAPEHHEHT